MSDHLCYGLSRYFDSTDPNDHEWCAKICHTCPALAECAALRDEMLAKDLVIEGTWAGQLYTGLKEPTHRPQCGTHGGPALHRKAGEGTCDECLEFRQAYERERYARQRQAASV